MGIDLSLLGTATQLLGQLAEPGPTEVLLHGDFHHANILSAEREPWLAIDPLPMIGDPAYDCVQYLLFRMGDLADAGTQWGREIDQFCRRLDVEAERVKA
jgi:streptomycin 6-kinase